MAYFNPYHDVSRSLFCCCVNQGCIRLEQTAGLFNVDVHNCPQTSVPALELERLGLDRVRKILKAPEMVARAIRQVRKADPEVSEREIIELLVESVVVGNGGVDLQLRVTGLGALVDELANH